MDTEFNFPNHWELSKIKDVFDIVKEKGIENTSPYLEIGDIDIHSKNYFLKEKPSVKGCKISKKGDLLISRVRPTRGAIVQIKENILQVSSAFTILRENDKLAQSFPFFYFAWNNTFLKYLGDNCKGSLYPTVSENILSDYYIPIPPISEQQAIVSKIEELLSELENGKKQLQIALQQLKVYRQSLLKWAFEGKLTNKNVKDGELPEGWKWVKLGEVIEKIETVKRKEKNPEEVLLYLDIGGIDNESNKIHNHKIYKWKDAPSRAQQIVYLEDILFSTVRTYMKNIAIIENIIYDGQIASSGFCVIRGNKKLVNHKFIFYYSTSQIFLQPLNELQTGSSYPAVRDKDVFSQPIPLPPLEEQILIVNDLESKLTVCDKIEETISGSLQQAKILQQSILKNAFEGKLV